MPNCLDFPDPPASGRIFAEGVGITDKKCSTAYIHRHIGTVFQHWNLFSHWTIIENLMRLQMDFLKPDRQEVCDRSIRVPAAFGLSDKFTAYPEELSGDRQQRAAIIRTFLMEPGTVVPDESASALDPRMVGKVQTVLSYYAKKGTTMLIVSHDMNFTRKTCSRMKALFITICMQIMLLEMDGDFKIRAAAVMMKKTMRSVRRFSVRADSLIPQIHRKCSCGRM